MILVLGSLSDPVSRYLAARLADSGHPYAVVDEDQPSHYSVRWESAGAEPVFHIVGGACTGTRSVGAMFVRHAAPVTTDAEHMRRLAQLHACLDTVLLWTRVPVANRPPSAYSNYSKPYQLGLLAEAGFEVPRTLLTNWPEAVRRFVVDCGGRVVYKGVSNVLTLAQLLTPETLPRLELLPNSPTLFQEYVEGVDYRVHVVGQEAFVTRLSAPTVDYRRSLAVQESDVQVEVAHLPDPVIARCIALTQHLGLIVSGLDFKETAAGRLVALELNPYPQFTFYERHDGQPVTRAIVDYLVQQHVAPSNVFV